MDLSNVLPTIERSTCHQLTSMHANYFSMHCKAPQTQLRFITTVACGVCNNLAVPSEARRNSKTHKFPKIHAI
jgi:hypothetical protein